MSNKSIKEKPRKTIKQLDMKSCTGCVAAMITGTSLKDFQKFINKEPPWYDSDLIKYCLEYGYYIGTYYELKGRKINRSTTLILEHDIKSTPAYIAVESERIETKTHAIFWNGEQVQDPNPTVADYTDISDYEIISLYPIIKLEKKE